VSGNSKNTRQLAYRAQRHWHKTFGEYLLKLLGVVLALGAFAVAWHYATEPPLPDVRTSSCQIRAPEAKSNLLLIVADQRGLRGGQVEALKQSLGAYFHLQITVAEATGLNSAMFEHQDAVTVFGNVPFDNPEPLSLLVDEIEKRSIPLLWIGLGIEAVADQLDLDVETQASLEKAADGVEIEYRGALIPASGLLLSQGTVTPREAAGQALAWVRTPDGNPRVVAMTQPGLVHVGFVPFHDMEPTLALPAAISALSSVLGEHERDPRVLLRLEDINCRDYGPEDTNFEATSVFLQEQEVFVHLCLIPIFVDADGEPVCDIGKAASVLDFINRNPLSLGLIQHGSRHHRNDPRNLGKATGDAYEFFINDDLTLGPDRAMEFARDRLLEGREVLAHYGLKSRIFEAPHYMMSPSQQLVAAELFDVIHHPPLFQAGIYSDVLMPWFTWNGDTAYAPSSIGYVEAGNPDSVSWLLHRLEQLVQILPDPVVVVHYHPFLTGQEEHKDALSTLIKVARRLGYRFASTCEELSRPYAATNK
jgi:hypothetical protein